MPSQLSNVNKQQNLISKIITKIGARSLKSVENLGIWGMMVAHALTSFFKPPIRFRELFKQMEIIGPGSLLITILTGAFTGAVFTLQVIYGFKQFSAETMVGPVVAWGMCRELGPVLTALIITGRVGGAMAAELGTMRVTEQIDALTVMAADPIKYLVTPRIIATIIMLPLLTIVANTVGIFGGYLVAVSKGVDPGMFIGRTLDLLKLSDVLNGLVKAAVFGLILSSVGCFKGFYSQGGAEGVGRSTTQAVVISYVAILISNFIITAILF